MYKVKIITGHRDFSYEVPSGFTLMEVAQSAFGTLKMLTTEEQGNYKVSIINVAEYPVPEENFSPDLKVTEDEDDSILGTIASIKRLSDTILKQGSVNDRSHPCG